MDLSTESHQNTHYDIIIYVQDTVFLFWYVVGTTVINNMLKIHDNIPPIEGVIGAWVKHKCAGKPEVFIMAGGGRWRCSRLPPVLSACAYSCVWVAIVRSLCRSCTYGWLCKHTPTDSLPGRPGPFNTWGHDEIWPLVADDNFMGISWNAVFSFKLVCTYTCELN